MHHRGECCGLSTCIYAELRCLQPATVLNVVPILQEIRLRRIEVGFNVQTLDLSYKFTVLKRAPEALRIPTVGLQLSDPSDILKCEEVLLVLLSEIGHFCLQLFQYGISFSALELS